MMLIDLFHTHILIVHLVLIQDTALAAALNEFPYTFHFFWGIGLIIVTTLEKAMV